MAREKFKTLTEQMYYLLLALQESRCGVDLMEEVRRMTDNRIRLGPGTLYTLLGDFQRANIIEETENDGTRRNYRITATGRELLEREYRRLRQLCADYVAFYGAEGLQKGQEQEKEKGLGKEADRDEETDLDTGSPRV